MFLALAGLANVDQYDVTSTGKLRSRRFGRQVFDLPSRRGDEFTCRQHHLPPSFGVIVAGSAAEVIRDFYGTA
jgi:hypothetical protein